MRSRPGDEEGAASARGWGIALAAALVVCVVLAVSAVVQGSSNAWQLGLVVVLAGGYAAAFALWIRHVPHLTPAAFVSSALTILVSAALTALVPSAAVFQFWAFPLLWSLLPGARRALPASLVLAAAVFGGFAISTGDEPGWLVTALLTQGISFGVSVVMGLWMSSIYAYGLQRDRLLTELTAAQHELAMLHRDAGTTAERERLARELHDTLAQSLTASVLLVQRSRRALADGALADADLELVEESVRTALTETRTLVAGNAPVELTGGGIAGALETLAARFRREAGIEVTVDVELDRPLDRETEVALLRCAQEGFGNIRKHADARRVDVRLRADAGQAVLSLRNDGNGFDPAAPASGYGLDGLRSRLGLVGGALHLDGTAGAVELRALIPLGGAS